MLIRKSILTDRNHIEAILINTGVFSPVEVACGIELFDAYIKDEAGSGYHFL